MAALKGLDIPMELTKHAGALRTQGFDFVMRYYSHNAAKNLSLGEARALSAAGLMVGVVWETAGTHAGFFTRAQGAADGAAAYQMAHGAIQQPAGSAIYFAVDYDATEADIVGPVSEYFDGVNAAFAAAAGGQGAYIVGVYGSGLCCDTLMDRRLASLAWLSQSTGFAGSKAFAAGQRYNLIQFLPTTVKLPDGAALQIDSDASNPDRPHGLFRLAAE
ncbi:MAG: glycoside hydrolase domain-containing protein [Telluria sp.]